MRSPAHSACAGGSADGLRAEHAFWVFGLPFLVLRDRITRRTVAGQAGAAPGPADAAGDPGVL